MRSKKEKTATTDSNNKLKKNQRKSVTSKSSSKDYSSAFDISNLIVVGVIKADEHSRLTFTKRIKSVFPVYPGNTIVIYQNPVTNELLFKVQHNNTVSDTWIVKKKTYGITNPILKTYSKKRTLNKEEQDSNRLYKENQQSKTSANIMIIDDDEDSLDAFKSLLQDFVDTDGPKINIDTFTLASEAIKKYLGSDYANKNSISYYDLIILDVKMPEINGLQLYQILHIINLNVNVLFISGLDKSEDLVGVLPGIRPEDILKKPFDAEQFILKVKEKINS
jgi:CheY-like chemotaxis protein